jgi:hypothetical protein
VGSLNSEYPTFDFGAFSIILREGRLQPGQQSSRPVLAREPRGDVEGVTLVAAISASDGRHARVGRDRTRRGALKGSAEKSSEPIVRRSWSGAWRGD